MLYPSPEELRYIDMSRTQSRASLGHRCGDSGTQLLIQGVAGRVLSALPHGYEMPAKGKEAKRQKKRKDKKDKGRDRGGVSKGAPQMASSTVERLRAERRDREAAEHIRQQRVLQQPIARCVVRHTL